MTKLALLLSVPVVVIIAAAFFVNPAAGSSSQNANSSTTTNKSAPETRQVIPQPKAPSGGGGQQDFSKNTWELPEDADKTKNPVEATPESVAKGKELYLEQTKGNCVFCHGTDGKGNEAMLPNLRRKPADISNKKNMSAMTDGELFWKISKGITGIMPSGERRMSEEERWQVVNYIRTLAKE
jgi:mono/diheme cytochrome c family protein